MARLARVEIFEPDEIAIVHVLNRTVRRCFLMGDDPLTGKNYDHRKQWMEEQLKRLAGQFGIDLLCHAIMSNHFHLVLRSRPDVVAQWDDTEVARRWLTLCPPRKDAPGHGLEPTEGELNALRKHPKRLREIRSRLSDISWWMRLLSQNIAQRANREDQEVGKFWQARYRAVRLLDETSLLACAAYVDLNPIRAAMAETLEESDYTSVRHRIEALQAEAQASKARGAKGAGRAKPGQSKADHTGASVADGYLAPLEINERRGRTGPCCHRGGQRASDKGFLPMSVAQYVELLDWTARQIVRGKRGSTPASARPVLERLGISGPTWCTLVKQFGRLFYAVAGQPHTIDGHQSRHGQHRYKTRRQTRELLAAG
jgi:REP element-mobilizing transposase RayT